MHDLILATATHLHPPEPDARVVVDADLSVLGAAMGRYVQYAIGVRREYGHLSDEAYSAGRWGPLLGGRVFACVYERFLGQGQGVVSSNIVL